MHSLLADLVLVLHLLFIGFVVLGFVLVVAGIGLRWSWVTRPGFRTLHLVCVAFIMVESWLGRLCPLTTWEHALRQAAGREGYTGSFVRHWLQPLVYYDLPPWVFTLAYTVFGALVLLIWALAPPRRTGRGP